MNAAIFALAMIVMSIAQAVAQTPDRSYRLIDAQGDRAVVAGSRGIGLLDARTGEELAHRPGSYSDVALYAGASRPVPVALQVFPGNPATVRAIEFTTALNPYNSRESHNPPFGGRIAGTVSDRWYWQAGRKAWFTERYQTEYGVGNLQLWRSIDPASIDIAASTDGFATIAGDTVTYYGSDGQERWTNDLGVRLTRIVADTRRIVALGVLQLSQHGNYIPSYIIDTATGELLAAAGSSDMIVLSAALHEDTLYLGRSVRGGTGAIDTYDLSDGITVVSSIPTEKAPLGIGVTEHGIIWVNGSAYWLPHPGTDLEVP